MKLLYTFKVIRSSLYSAPLHSIRLKRVINARKSISQSNTAPLSLLQYDYTHTSGETAKESETYTHALSSAYIHNTLTYTNMSERVYMFQVQLFKFTSNGFCVVLQTDKSDGRKRINSSIILQKMHGKNN